MSDVIMVHVSSSNVDSIGYDDHTSTLFVQFIDGSKYAYSNVPKYVYEDLLSSSSVGSYLHVYVKNQYSHEKIG